MQKYANFLHFFCAFIKKYYLCSAKRCETATKDRERWQPSNRNSLINYNIEARYPEDKEELSRTLTKDFCRQIIDETKQLQQWIKDKL